MGCEVGSELVGILEGILVGCEVGFEVGCEVGSAPRDPTKKLINVNNNNNLILNTK